jgi:hypothetical protein
VALSQKGEIVMNVDQLKEAVEWAKKLQVLHSFDMNKYLPALLSLAEKVIEIGGRIPKKHSTYEHRYTTLGGKDYKEIDSRYGAGWNDAIDECIKSFAGKEVKREGYEHRTIKRSSGVL